MSTPPTPLRSPIKNSSDAQTALHYGTDEDRLTWDHLVGKHCHFITRRAAMATCSYLVGTNKLAVNMAFLID